MSDQEDETKPPATESNNNDHEPAKQKLNKNQKRKLRNKRKKLERKQIKNERESAVELNGDDQKENSYDADDENVEIEYVPEKLEIDDSNLASYFKVFERFSTDPQPAANDKAKNAESTDDDEELKKRLLERKKPQEFELKEDEENEDGESKISKRKLKQMTRMTISELKQKVNHPELVEMHDVTAKDPLSLLNLKSTRNTVPVPRHWCYKRKYLQGKRGYEKPAFRLPDFIKRTGIMEMREALQEKEDAKTLKAKMKEKIRPKLGKIDIDYQKLHDAFFKWQTKPKMTIHGDLYYEGKEFETRLKEKKPGELSNDLRVALGMPTGLNAHKCPPPWLIAQQRYGPPPSYGSLKIPGLNSPIPEGCSFGYHAGGWGKPPVNELGQALYGDVFGTMQATENDLIVEPIDTTLWGEMESEEDEESEAEDEAEEDEEAETEGKEADDQTGLITPAVAEGLVTPSGLTSSITAGLETPDIVELRKKRIESEMDSADNPQLYHILQEKRTDKIRKDIMGSTHVYDIGGAANLRKKGGVEVALDPRELETIDATRLAAKYEETIKKQQETLQKEDFSDMVAEHAVRQKRKNKDTTSSSSSKQAKKYKDFKF